MDFNGKFESPFIVDVSTVVYREVLVKSDRYKL